ncbi:MAG TPA: hypothetical protein VIK78_03360 [Ruminiclostridium sp.]
MNKNAIVSESYNKSVEAGFNSFLEEHATSENCEIKVDEEKLIAEIEEEWLNKEIAEIGNITPKEYIRSFVSLEALVEFFISIASVSDVGAPDILIDRLKEYGKPAADMLFNLIKESLGSQDQSMSLAIPQAVYAIGCIRIDEYKIKLISLLIDSCKDEMISEAICAAIALYDDTILEDLINTFNATDQALVQEHLLTCVVEISKEHRSDEIFYFLKNAFRVVSNLKLSVEVLGDYGDGRAIPLLRGYVLKNIKEMDKATFNHMRAVIKKLGGEIDDLVYID